MIGVWPLRTMEPTPSPTSTSPDRTSTRSGTSTGACSAGSRCRRAPGYTLLRTPDDGPNGALNEADAPAVTIGVAVDDLDRAVAAATASGGSVEMPPTDNGWVVKAQVRDPAGNLLTLIAR